MDYVAPPLHMQYDASQDTTPEHSLERERQRCTLQRITNRNPKPHINIFTEHTLINHTYNCLRAYMSHNNVHKCKAIRSLNYKSTIPYLIAHALHLATCVDSTVQSQKGTTIAKGPQHHCPPYDSGCPQTRNKKGKEKNNRKNYPPEKLRDCPRPNVWLYYGWRLVWLPHIDMHSASSARRTRLPPAANTPSTSQPIPTRPSRPMVNPR